MFFIAATACKKEEPAVPKIQLGSETVTFAAEGGVETVTYNIENAVDGISVSASIESSDWLTVSTERPRVIEMTADEYDGAEERTAEVVISYNGAESVKISVTQAAFVAPFSIDVTDIQATSVSFNVTATSQDMTWVAQCVGKEWWEDYESDEAVFKADMEFFQWTANDQNMSLSEYLNTVLLKGSKEGLQFKGLDPESEYVIYVYGMDTEGVTTSAIYSAEVTTTPPYDGDITFSIDVTEENHVLDITITPSHEGVAYTWNIFDKATFEGWGNEIPAAFQSYIDSTIEEYIYWGDIYDASEYYGWYSDFGTVNSQFECIAGQEYIILAAKWNEGCKIVGEVGYKWVTTEGVEPSSNKITLSVSNPDQSSFSVTTTTTNSDPYIVLAEPTEWCGWNTMSDDEIHQYVLDYYGTWFVMDYVCEGPLDDARFYDLESGTEYTVIAYGYEAGIRTTEIQKATVSTTAGGDPADCTFEFKVIETTSTTAQVSVTPSDASHYYYWMIYESDTTADEVKADIQNTIDKWYYGDMWEFSYSELVRGENAGEVSYLSPSTEYRVAAVIMDDATGEFLSDVAFSEPFTTPDMVYANINVTATFDKYYDGDALAAAVEDTYDQYKGYAMLPVKINVDGDYAELYCTVLVYEEGLENPEVYSDNDLYSTLIQNGYSWGTEVNYRAPWDTDLMIAAMAIDYDGNYSVIYRHKFNLSKEGASPIEDIIETKSAAQTFDLASFSKPESKIELKREEVKIDDRFSTDILNAKKAEYKMQKDAAAKETEQARLAKRKSEKKLTRGQLAF